MKSAARSAILVGIGILVGCVAIKPNGPIGKYSSRDDYGVIVFSSDGTFHYVFATKVDFFDDTHLPRNQAKWYLDSAGKLVVEGLRPGEPQFHFEWHPQENVFYLMRDQPEGTLPLKALYVKDHNG
jgi:hypothetical protein